MCILNIIFLIMIIIGFFGFFILLYGQLSQSDKIVNIGYILCVGGIICSILVPATNLQKREREMDRKNEVEYVYVLPMDSTDYTIVKLDIKNYEDDMVTITYKTNIVINQRKTEELK